MMLDMQVPLHMLVVALVFILVLLPMVAIAARKQAAHAKEIKELYRQSIELSREGNAITRELIEALRAKR
jgi:MFS-type transporter involved in bile tolerance (Atg22 family)